MYPQTKLVKGVFALSVFLAACSPQDEPITPFYVDNRTAQSVVVEYELGVGETQTSDVIAGGTEEVLYSSFGSCLDVAIFSKARIYTLDETLLRTVTDPSVLRKEPLPSSCAWYLELR